MHISCIGYSNHPYPATNYVHTAHGGRSPRQHFTPSVAVDIPLVITFHGYTLDRAMRQYNSPLQNLHYSTDLKWLTRKAVKSASAITAVSRCTAELVRKDTGLEQKIRVIYNGIDETQFVPTATRETGSQSINVLFSGNLTHKKGANLLPDIAARLNPGIRILDIDRK